MDKAKVAKAISKSLLDARKETRLTQADVAKAVHIHVNHYAKIERGETIPSLMTLANILKVLDAKSSDVLPF
jgi:transcriptional regulator with XRE-family HTH domain